MSDIPSDTKYDKALDIAAKHLTDAIVETSQLDPGAAGVMLQVAVGATADMLGADAAAELVRALADHVESVAIVHSPDGA